MRLAKTALSLLLALGPGAAGAGSVYLNGINIDGVTGQKFEKCTVKIDDHGNVLIEAPGYAAKVVLGSPQAPRVAAATPPPPTPAPAPAPVVMAAPVYAPRPPPEAPARITKRYWLVTNQTVTGMTEYDVDVYLNAKWLMRLKNDSDQDVVDITRHLLPGKNSVTFEARKLNTGQPRKSFSAEHVFTVVVGEGNEGGGNVMIDNPLATFKRTAADTESTSKEYSFTTR